LPEGGDLGKTDIEEVSPWCEQMFFGKEEGHFSPWLIDTFCEYIDLLQSALQVPPSMIILTAVRNRDDKVYSVTASCCWG
jgi:hypothetical protein